MDCFDFKEEEEAIFSQLGDADNLDDTLWVDKFASSNIVELQRCAKKWKGWVTQ